MRPFQTRSSLYSLALTFAFTLAACGPLASGAAPPTPTVSQARVSAQYGRLPLSFEANQGQAGADAQFVARGEGYGLALNAQGAELVLRGSSAHAHAMRSTRYGHSPQMLAGAWAVSDTAGSRSGTHADVIRMQLAGANADATPTPSTTRATVKTQQLPPAGTLVP